MTPAPVLPNELSISRARLKQRGGGQDGRRLLEGSLSAVAVFDIAGADEVLVVPHMRAHASISPRMPHSHFAAQITSQLRQIRRDALVDPVSGVAQGRAMRFTSHDRYAAWLVATWLQPPSLQARDMLVELLNGQSVEQWQRRNILHDGQRTVRLVCALAGQGMAVRWIERLDAGDCKTIVMALGRAFGFQPKLASAAPRGHTLFDISSVGQSPDDEALWRSPIALKSASVPSLAVRTLQSTARSASIRAGDALADLPPDRQALLLVILMLAERPNIGNLLHGETCAMLSQMAVNEQQTDARPSIPVGNAPGSAPEIVYTQLLKMAPHAQQDQSPISPRAKAAHLEIEKSRLQSSGPIRSGSKPPPQRAATVSSINALDVAATSAMHFDTEFGGLLFVLNILLALKLYPDFTEPLGRRLEPSPFWLLAFLGVELFGAAFRRDPLFHYLRAVGQPGALPRKWLVNPQWLAGLAGGGTLRRSFNGRHVTSWDSRGFIFSDRAERPWSRKAICARPQARRLSAHSLPASTGSRWIACLAQFVRFRIGCAAPGLDIGKFRLPATVEPEVDGLEVRFSLANLPMAIRLAGLDRNPGWLPSEGRSVSFQFS